MSDFHLLTGVYALDAVDDAEREHFERHLADCEECAEEVDSLREAAALLTELTAVTAPPALTDDVRSAVAQVRPLPPVVRRRVLPRQRAGLLAAAAAVVVAGAGVAVWSSLGDGPDSTTHTPTVAERVLAADDAQREVVDLGEAGRATVVRSVSQDRAVLLTEDMVAPPRGKVYQVWFATPQDDMVPAGVMARTPDQTLVLDGSARDATGVGITVEPIGGSKAPTSDPIVLFDLAES
ncbi:anti-sigma factor [Nocardioides sp. Y6]|uniref:Regulator of SigK n=1 Tax=Nocardioides malaquae TaxID=2773426 RepID=A0ABR9RU29_9ACTN|nr:anti-sigma factor [Nocardioides malaquae]MBE7324645.1 anti-sigma factor [Nocardioides malaquae]